ncbi:MAG: DUF3842 family protein [Clostridia bacterium]|nr:DUF3842 family protein [Clostridia bacterium]
MDILIIDGQGGNLGRQLAKRLREALPQADMVVVGTNSTATENMLKGGANRAATGENAVLVNARRAKIIAGPLGIVIADALMGEVTPAMAMAVGQSDAVRVLIPMNRCDTLVAGVADKPMGELVEDAVRRIVQLLQKAD